MCLQGGYKTQTVVQLGNLLGAFNNGTIPFRALRVYFAALVAVASREAVERSRKKGSRKSSSVQYLASELARLSCCSVQGVRRELRVLERAGLLLFSESEIVFTRAALPNGQPFIESLAGGRSPARPIPLPRPWLRFIARCSRIATIKTMLAYCVRGLSLSRSGEISGKGTAKAGWIAETWGISLRAVRLARVELIALGFISRDEGSKQWKLNRDGSYFSVSMMPTEAIEGPEGDAERTLSQSHFALPTAEIRTPFAPLYKEKKTPYGLKNQRTCSREYSGSLKRENQELPRLTNVRADDLRSISRMCLLHHEAVKSGLAREGEAGRLEFLAGAIHATSVGRANPSGLFATIVSKRLWHVITHADEERARRALKRAEATSQIGNRQKSNLEKASVPQVISSALARYSGQQSTSAALG